MMEDDFYFTLNPLFIPNILKFLSQLFGHLGKKAR